MRKETKILKRLIEEKYPNNKVSVLMRETNYAFSSDVIKVKTDIPFAELKKFLQTVTTGICIYEYGKEEKKKSDELPSVNGYDDTMVEYIEIDSTQ